MRADRWLRTRRHRRASSKRNGAIQAVSRFHVRGEATAKDLAARWVRVHGTAHVNVSATATLSWYLSDWCGDARPCTPSAVSYLDVSRQTIGKHCEALMRTQSIIGYDSYITHIVTLPLHNQSYGFQISDWRNCTKGIHLCQAALFHPVYPGTKSVVRLPASVSRSEERDLS